jgi:membrane AbrB-like protein
MRESAKKTERERAADPCSEGEDRDQPPATPKERHGAARKALTWAALLAASLLVGGLLQRQGFPAAFFVGAMACAVVFALSGAGLAPPRKLFLAAQSLLGCAVAESVTGAIVVTIAKDWAAVSLITASTILAGGLVGWTLVKARALPGTTAAWGSAPGGASAMVAMAEAYGADARLVALMHYLRIVIVVLTASVVAHLLSGSVPPAVAAAPATLAFGDWPPLLATLALAAGGGFLGYRLKVPAGALLVPMLLAGALHACDLVTFHEPLWLKAAAAMGIGWYVGLGFNRKLLLFAFRLLPRILLSIVLLIGLCALSAWLLVVITHADPLTAYLATTPGGLDSVVLIAMGGEADVALVVAVQTLRLFAVILAGPAIARAVCRHA